MRLVERICQLEVHHAALLVALPPGFQALFHSRHKEAAAEPGAPEDTHLTGVSCLVDLIWAVRPSQPLLQSWAADWHPTLTVNAPSHPCRGREMDLPRRDSG